MVDDVSCHVLRLCAFERNESRFSNSLHSDLRALSSDLVALSYKDAERMHTAAARLAEEAAQTPSAEARLKTALGIKPEEAKSKKQKSFGQNVEFKPPSEVLVNGNGSLLPRSDAPEYSFLADVAASAAASFSVRNEITFDLEKTKAMQEIQQQAAAQTYSGPKRDGDWLEAQIKVKQTIIIFQLSKFSPIDWVLFSRRNSTATNRPLACPWASSPSA